MFEPPERIVDLSLPLEHDMPVWPSFPPVDLERTALRARDGFTMEKVEMRTHTGTHVDSPRHFVPEGPTLDSFPIEKFMGAGVVLDMTDVGNAAAITVEQVARYEDDIEIGDVIMLNTCWDQYHGHTNEWYFEFPHLTREASEYLADLEPKAVGIDTQSVGGWYDDAPAHEATTDVHPKDSHLPLLSNNILTVEELTNLDEVREGATTKRAYFLYPPLNFQDTSGSSVRAFAFL
jgi:kynurenine formamidase